MRQPVRSLLLVDDEPYILPALVALLKNEFQVHTANSADEAEHAFGRNAIDIVLTDQNMPGRTGIQLLEWVRQHSPKTIRLLMTGYAEVEDAVAAINRGQVYYYLLKPWRTEDLVQILRNAAEKFDLERSHEQLLEELRKVNRELEHRVTERTRELERLALTDQLTGLFNRRAMETLALAELKRHARYDNPLAIGIIDVDNFKQINTEHLLTGGDAVLRGLARILSSSVREVVDSVGRIGGEEFLVIARETNEEGAMVLGERVRTTVARTPIDYQGQSLAITVSIGFAVVDAGVMATYQEMYETAAQAMQSAKQAGRNRCVVRAVKPGLATVPTVP